MTKEISKLEDKSSKLQTQLGKLKDSAAKSDYQTKVPENVRQQNTEKVCLCLFAVGIYQRGVIPYRSPAQCSHGNSSIHLHRGRSIHDGFPMCMENSL